MEIRYFLNLDWQIKSNPKILPFPWIQNSLGGKILLDAPVKAVLESLPRKGITLHELRERNLISRNLLDIFLEVFTQAGVLRAENESTSRYHPLAHLPLRETPLMSVVIVNYNGDPHLLQLLRTLSKQTYRNREIIIIDNHSADNSCTFIRENHPEVHLIALKRNIGFAAAVNMGVEAAKGQYILVLNNDIMLDQNALYELAKKASEIPGKWSAIAPKMKFFNNPSFINSIGNSLYPITWGSDNYIGALDYGQFDHIDESFSACFGAVLLNRDVVEEIGLLDPRYKFYYEDMDWSYRAQLHGYPIYTAPQSIIYHKFGASMKTKKQAFKTRFIVGNRLYFTLKNLGSPFKWRFFANYLWEDIRSVLIYLKRREISMVFAYMRGYLRLLRSLPRLFFQSRKLRNIQKERNIQDYTILAKTAPLDMTFMTHGYPKIDVAALRSKYSDINSNINSNINNNEKNNEKNNDIYNNIKNNDIYPDDIVVWRQRPPKKDKNSHEKIYMQFGFNVPQSGDYDIHLLGLLPRPVTLYLDGQPVDPGKNSPPETVNVKHFRVSRIGASNVNIQAGNHYLELERRTHVHAIIFRKVDKTKK